VNKKSILGILFFLAISVIFLSSCQDSSFVSLNQTGASDLSPASPSAVFTESNQSAGNEVLVYSRAPNGNLTFVNSYSTQGTGTGSGLGSQGAMTFTRGGSILIAVNAGSNEISVFSATGAGLNFLSKVSSGGTMPISVTAHGSLVYVLNAGGSGNITGFYFAARGVLSPIPNSTRFLSNNGVGNAPGPAEISFNPSGSVIAVTEKPTNNILTYTVNADGTVNGPNVNPSAGRTPFGFEFRNDEQLIVSEAFGGVTDSSAVTSYAVNSSGNVSLISGPMFTTETAACWIAITNNRMYTYTTNTGSGTITGYRISAGGELAILNADGVTANLGAGTSPIDMALSVNSRYLYCLNSGTHTISSLRVNGDGSLTPINLSAVTGLPNGTSGLLAK
jgi:6-phosphogluconolactonase